MEASWPSGTILADSERLDLLRPEDLVSARILRRFEERYWRPIQDSTTLEALLTDDMFFEDPDHHVGMFSDHGIVHVRDVAQRAAQLVPMVHGVLIESSTPQRLRFIQGCAVLMAYLHDIGMAPANTSGRKVHAQFAAQTAFTTEFDVSIDDLWTSDAGGLRSRIDSIHEVVPFAVPGRMVLREVLAMAFCHSKSAVAATVLDDGAALREMMRHATFTRLETQLAAPGSGAPGRRAYLDSPSAAVHRYDDMGRNVDDHAFAWLVEAHPLAKAFMHDVVDAIRVLRAADALRQRGTTQRTSAGFEICTSRLTGDAVFAMRTADRHAQVLVSNANPMSSGEANLRYVEITDRGTLRIALHRGQFADDSVAARHAPQLATVIVDIVRDALGSFNLPNFAFDGALAGAVGTIEIVRPHDDRSFAELLRDRLHDEDTSLRGRVMLVDEPASPTSPDLIEWPMRGEPFEPDDATLSQVLRELSAHGQRDLTDPRRAFVGVRRTKVMAGERVMAPRTDASVVLVPMGAGLVVQPVGGYPPAAVDAWMPLGVTGVVRGSERNAHVSADAEVDVLAIPTDVYLAEWFRPFEVAELRGAALRWRA